MGRLLGLDYGTKRVGIAETDDLQIIASPLTTVHSTEVITFITEYATKYALDTIVIGEPKALDTSATHATKLVSDFVKHLKKKLPAIEIKMVDERFTSKMASQAMITSGVKKSKRREKGMIDKVSAAIILKSFLDQKF